VLCIIGDGMAAFVDPFFQFGDEEGDVGGDLRLPICLEPRCGQLELFAAQVEPSATDFRAVECDEGIALLDLLAERNVNLADKSGSAGTDFNLAVGVNLGHAHDGNSGSHAFDAGRLDGELDRIELRVFQGDALRLAGHRRRRFPGWLCLRPGSCCPDCAICVEQP
jgi:hypothetical protein